MALLRSVGSVLTISGSSAVRILSMSAVRSLSMSAVRSLGASTVRSLSASTVRNLSVSAARLKTFEPDYLDSAGPQIPTYPPINIQIKGYNFDILESFQSYVHNLAENMGIDVNDAWASPPQSYKMATYHEGGVRVKSEVNINIYERNVQVNKLRSVDAPIFLDIIRTALPEGVQLSLHEHTEAHYEERFIPDPFIDSLQSELAADDEKREALKAGKEAVQAAKTARKQAELLKTLE